MLYIVFAGKKPKPDVEWHVGEKLPDTLNLPGSEIALVYADGHELEWLEENVVNLPHMKDGSSMQWFGDTAKMIACVLPKKY